MTPPSLSGCALVGFAMPLLQAVMERDKEEGHFERQAKTMDVIDTFIGDMAPSRVEISGACRERILASEVTRWALPRYAFFFFFMLLSSARTVGVSDAIMLENFFFFFLMLRIMLFYGGSMLKRDRHAREMLFL